MHLTAHLGRFIYGASNQGTPDTTLPLVPVGPASRKRKHVDTKIRTHEPLPDLLFGLEQRQVSPHFVERHRRALAFIDVGRTNMGLCFMTNDSHWNDPVVEHVARVDIAQGPDHGGQIHHGDDALVAARVERPPEGDCHETADLVARFVISWGDAFNACERIFIERQPPGGMRDIEQLLYAALGGSRRVCFLAPNSLHAYFRIGARHGWGVYDQRKVRAEAIAARYISANGRASGTADWDALGERRHDAADATLMGILVNERKRREWVELYGEPACVTKTTAIVRKRPPKRQRGAVGRTAPLAGARACAKPIIAPHLARQRDGLPS
jgi:hypothetical protein